MIDEKQLQEWERLANQSPFEYVGVSCLANGLYRMDMPRVCYELARASPEAIPALIAEVRRLNAREQHATELINAGVDLMTVEQLGKWASVRTYLELASNDYL